MNSSTVSHNLFQMPNVADFRDAAAALIILDDGRYLMQLRDDKPGIFYPNHWGLFGGAIEEKEDAEIALRRELQEEIAYNVDEMTYFTRMDFGFEMLGGKSSKRLFYEVRMPATALRGLRLGEGHAMSAMAVDEILLEHRVVPYDSFAIWLHHVWRRSVKSD